MPRPQLSFRWTASTDNVGVVRYQVFRGTVQVGEPTGTSFTLGDLKPSTSYHHHRPRA